MRAWQRWLAVATGVAVLAAVPPALAALPANDTSVSAQELLQRIQSSADVAFQGYAEARGALVLPVTDQFTDVVDLFGQTSRLRAYWNGPQDWRVDTITASGETDVFHRADATVTWDYESLRASLVADPDVRLPRAADLLPSALGRRLLSEADAGEVQRLPARRVAGRDGVGLRLSPADARSTITRVDVWAEQSTGVPLRVEVSSNGRETVTATFLDFTLEPPADGVTGFVAPPGAEFSFDDVPDVAAAVDRFGPVAVPSTLAGLPRRDDLNSGAVGEYGRGVTLLTASPVWDRISRSLRDQLEATPGAIVDDAGVSVTAGPLTLLLTPGSRRYSSWIVVGTVDRDTVVAAAQELQGLRVPDQ